MTYTKYNIQDIFDVTDNGRKIIEEIIPESSKCFNSRKNFSLRPDDKKPSCSVFKDKSGVWLLQDKGGTDNKAYNAIQLLANCNGIDFKEAIKLCYEKYIGTNETIKTTPIKEIKAVIEKTDVISDTITISDKKHLTEKQLLFFGKDIKQEHATALNLFSLDFYITKTGYKISATNDYPIFYYDHGNFGKIYQPLNSEFRFIYVGNKEHDYIFSDNHTAKLLQKIRTKQILSDSSDEDADPSDLLLKSLIICSGPSDAINVYAQGYNVIWFNSETAEISSYQYHIISSIIDRKGKLYLLPDLDTTGVRTATAIGAMYLDIHIIWLPDKLKAIKDYNGKNCKDAKDFFNYYTEKKYPNISYLFKELVRIAQPLKFWSPIYNDKRKITGYDINNEVVYTFLKANGFYTMEMKSNKNEWIFIHICDNIVYEISEKRIAEYINQFLISFIKKNIEYFDIKLLNCIHRTNQLKIASLSKLPRIKLDFTCYGPDYDYFFFKNAAVKITANSIEPVKWINFDKYVFDYKIKDFDFKLLEPPFEIKIDPAIESLEKQYAEACRNVDLPRMKELKEGLAAIPDNMRFMLNIKDNVFSLIKYLYNTGRVHWKKEEKNTPLSMDEKKEHDLHFISKVCALGYALYRYKVAGNSWALYCMETDFDIDSGQHIGGTGKSFFLEMIEQIRNVVRLDGQKKSLIDDKHMFGRVIENVTDFVFIDDLSASMPLKNLFVAITGQMIVEPKFIESYSIPFQNTPKIGFTSNHAIKNFDSSLRRRLWLTGFSSYYHAEDKLKGMKERSMLTEFGKSLIFDFTPEETNKMYNFFAYCLKTYLTFNERINPPLQSIEKRNLKSSMSDDFLFWAEEYFTEEKLNVNVSKDESFSLYVSTLNKKEATYMKQKKFKEKLILYCQYKGYIFNPESMLTSTTEIQRNDIRVNNQYYFYIQT